MRFRDRNISSRVLVSFALTACLVGPTAYGQDVGKWRRHVTSLTNCTYSGNPFELEIDATFTHVPSGGTITLPGYYAGNDTWKVGFMPTELGQWNYLTSSADSDLDNQSGSLNCVASGLSGMLKADPTHPMKWKFADGGYVTPIALRNEFYSRPGNASIFNGAADFQSNNNLLMMETRLTEEYGLWEGGRHDYIFDGHWSNHQFDLDIWDRMEERMSSLTDRGLGGHIMFYSDDAGKPGWSAQSATEALVIRYAVARLGGYPVVMFNTGIDIREYRNQSNIDWFGEHLRGLDPYDHPVSSRYGGGSGTYVMAGQTFDSRGDRVAIIADMISYFQAADVPVSMDDAWGENMASHPNKNFTPADIRRAFWKCVAAGGLGGLIRGSSTSEHGLFGFDDIETDLESEQWLRLVNPFVQTHLGETFGEMVPSPSLVSNGYALADPYRRKILYFTMGPNDKWDVESGGAVTVKLTGLAGVFQGFWFDPRTGDETPIADLTGGTDYILNLPSEDDWVLLLRPEYLPGDLNEDGFVGQDDLDIVLGEWGDSVTQGSAPDPSGDGFVGQDDLDVVLDDWGQSTQPIPEPLCLVMLLAGGIGLTRRRIGVT